MKTSTSIYDHYIEIYSPDQIIKWIENRNLSLSNGYDFLLEHKRKKMVERGIRLYTKYSTSRREHVVWGYDLINVSYAKTIRDVAHVELKYNNKLKLWKK